MSLSGCLTGALTTVSSTRTPHGTSGASFSLSCTKKAFDLSRYSQFVLMQLLLKRRNDILPRSWSGAHCTIRKSRPSTGFPAARSSEFPKVLTERGPFPRRPRVHVQSVRLLQRRILASLCNMEAGTNTGAARRS